MWNIGSAGFNGSATRGSRYRETRRSERASEPGRPTGGGATRSAFAVLCELMEAEHREEAPGRDRLTIEHVMPQKLTDEWKDALGDDAEEIHGRHRDRLPNLTLSGDVTNTVMGTGTFAAKRRMYRESSIGITRSLADETDWNEEALERRSEFLARRALDRWPWPEQVVPTREVQNPSTRLRWRIGDGLWHAEGAASQMVLNVAAALLGRDPTNAQKLSGEAISSNVHSASRYPPGDRGRHADHARGAGARRICAVPLWA